MLSRSRSSLLLSPSLSSPFWYLRLVTSRPHILPPQADAQALIHKHVMSSGSLSYDALDALRDTDGYDVVPARSIMRVCDAKIEAVKAGFASEIADLQQQLQVLHCSRCGKRAVRAQFNREPCVTWEHSGVYVCYEGWSCCDQRLKKSEGCKERRFREHAI